jgi:CBS-domain-containing membrane protein
MNSTVADVMTRSVVAVRETAGYKDIVKVMRRRRVSAFPVLDSADHVVGVVSEADLLLKEAVVASASTGTVPPWAAGRKKERAKATGVAAAELMTRPAVTIGPDATVAAAARLMYSRHVKRLPVVDATGRLVGIVSRVDVLSVFGRPDEQIRAEAIEVIGGAFALDPDSFDVTVKSGIVTITGPVERRAVAHQLLEAVRYIEGVVDVRDRLSYPPADVPKIAGII